MKSLTRVLHPLTRLQARTFFWNASKSSAQAEESEDISDMKNLKYLID